MWRDVGQFIWWSKMPQNTLKTPEGNNSKVTGCRYIGTVLRPLGTANHLKKNAKYHFLKNHFSIACHWHTSHILTSASQKCHFTDMTWHDTHKHTPFEFHHNEDCLLVSINGIQLNCFDFHIFPPCRLCLYVYLSVTLNSCLFFLEFRRRLLI